MPRAKSFTASLTHCCSSWVFEALDPDVPATLSRRVLGEILRGELGYRGVVVSDDLDMKAIADHIGVAESAVGAIEAGCDALLLCRDRAHLEIRAPRFRLHSDRAA